ncbi:MAG: C40 family peptidase [Treponema sp.]
MNVFQVPLKTHALFAALLLCLIPAKTAAECPVPPEKAKTARETLIAEAQKHIGAPYAHGAVGPNKFDCSGFVFYVARQSVGCQLPRTSKAIYARATPIADEEREAGDFVFFKTASGISHVGIFIGNGKFISAASDGPKTGVIVSSLNENYWKRHYAGSGRFLPASNANGSADNSGRDIQNEEKLESNESRNEKTNEDGASQVRAGQIKSARWSFDGELTADWSLFTRARFMPNFRGLTGSAHAVYKGKILSPGAGVLLRWNYGVKAFQIPIVLSLSFGDFARAYAGPIFTVGTCREPDTDEPLRASIFPGIIGVTFNTPPLNKGAAQVALIQDVNYTVFNDSDNAALDPLRSLAAGLVFSTGVRVTFPLSPHVKSRT